MYNEPVDERKFSMNGFVFMAFSDKSQIGARILVVDDDRQSQILALNWTHEFGHYSDVACSGWEAIEALKSISYDLVLMDVNMPCMDGIETSVRIRHPESNVLNHDVPIIAIAGGDRHAKNNKLSCFRAGMNEYLPKPYKSEELHAAILRQLSRVKIQIL